MVVVVVVVTVTIAAAAVAVVGVVVGCRRHGRGGIDLRSGTPWELFHGDGGL